MIFKDVQVRIAPILSAIVAVATFFTTTLLITAAWVSSMPYWTPTAAIVLGSAACAFLFGVAPFCFGFFSLLLIISGFARASLFDAPQPLMLFFSGGYLGLLARSVQKRSRSSGFEHASDGCVDTFASLLLGGFIAVSLCYQILKHREAADSLKSWFTHLGGFGDPKYFIFSATLWLQSLAFFRWAKQSFASHRNWLPCGLKVSAIAVVGFALIQAVWRIPDLAYVAGAGISSPLEDISSFGSVAAALGIYFLAIPASPEKRWQNVGLASAMLAAVILSWSRATWVAYGLCGAVVMLRRLELRRRIQVAVIGTLVVSILCVLATYRKLPQTPYFKRLADLLRFEAPAQKSPERVFLYRKAISMIAEKPLTGFGIGSFYLESVRHARPDDPNASTPNFAHNCFLQVAAELGLLAAAALILLVVSAAWPSGETTYPFVLVASALCYLLTQLSANSLNVYPSNQFFFFGLLGAIAADTTRMNQAKSSLITSASVLSRDQPGTV